MKIHKLKHSPKQNNLLLTNMLAERWNNVSHRHIIYLNLMHCYSTHMAITNSYNQTKKRKKQSIHHIHV
jgi:hypothetical protein